MNKLLKYQFHTAWPSLLTFTIVAIFLYFLSGFSFFFNSENLGTFNGIEMMGLIMCFVMFVSAYGENLRFTIQNGQTRKNVFLSTIISALFMSFALSFLAMLINTIMKVFFEGSTTFTYMSAVEITFGAGGSLFETAIQNFVFTFAMLLLASIFGVLLAAMFAKAGKIGRILIAAGVPIGMFMIFPMILSYLFKIMPNVISGLLDIFSYLMGFATDNPYLGSLTMVVASAVLGFIAYLVTKKIEIK